MECLGWNLFSWCFRPFSSNNPTIDTYERVVMVGSYPEEKGWNAKANRVSVPVYVCGGKTPVRHSLQEHFNPLIKQELGTLWFLSNNNNNNNTE